MQHVLDRVAESGLNNVVVVLGAAAEAIEGAIAWRTERRVRNPNPERGLASSLQVGLAAMLPDTRVALVVLGDQPRVRVEVITALLRQWGAGSAPIVVPRYASSGTMNPVLLGRAVWHAAQALDGDRGMGPLIHAAPELVTHVPVAGDNPDVDTPADLDRLAGSEAVGEETS